jgi:hypothetical protein
MAARHNKNVGAQGQHMNLCLFIVIFILATISWPIYADESKKNDSGDSMLFPAVAIGFSYPLIFSVSAGEMLPLGKLDEKEAFPTVPALRLDGEAGIGGGSASVGLYIPIGSSYAFNLKGTRLRTWIVPWNVESNRTFDGSVVEFVVLGHSPIKLGLGRFKDRELLNNGRDSFNYVFLGMGW